LGDGRWTGGKVGRRHRVGVDGHHKANMVFVKSTAINHANDYKPMYGPGTTANRVSLVLKCQIYGFVSGPLSGIVKSVLPNSQKGLHIFVGLGPATSKKNPLVPGE